MNATPPEARSQYSRGLLAFAGPALLALIGAGLLIAAEFTRLYSVHLITSTSATQTVSVGSHNSYALIPIAVLAGLLALGPARAGVRTAYAALAALGVLGLAIALIGDLPDASSHGLTTHYVLAATTPGPGLYLESLGAVLVLAAGGIGLLRGGFGRNARTAHYTGPGAAAGQSSPSQM
jgi:hypothetical protein